MIYYTTWYLVTQGMMKEIEAFGLKQVNVLLNDQEFRNLRFCSEMNNETMDDVLRNGLEDYFWKTISLIPIFEDEDENEDEEKEE